MLLQIDYTFHGSAYYTFSLLLMIWYFANAALALGFHFGPLLFLFYDYIPRSKRTQSLFQKLAAVCATFSTRAELYVLQHLACMPPPSRAHGRADVDTTGLQLMAGKSESAVSSCDAHHPAPAPGVSRMTLVFGRVVDVQIELWNRSLFLQWLPTLLTCGRSAAMRVHDLLDVFECRYLFVMQRDGLLLGFFMAVRSSGVYAWLLGVVWDVRAESLTCRMSIVCRVDADCDYNGKAAYSLCDAV